MMNVSRLIGAFLSFIMFLGVSHAEEKADFIPDKVIKKVLKQPKGKKNGWTPLLKASGNVSFSHNSKVVGQEDGATWTLGFILNSAFNYFSDKGHEWKNTMNWQLSYIKTPLLERFVKSMDMFELSSTYLYHFPKLKWFGPFANLTLKSSILKGYTIKSTDTTVKYIEPDGTEFTKDYKAQESIDLTELFSPTTIRGGLGFFAEPVTKKAIKVYLQLGGGVWQILGRGGWIVSDDDKTPELEVKKVQDSLQLGGEFNVQASGVLKKIFTYGGKANIMVPFYKSISSDLSATELINYEFELNAGVKLSSWASLDYSLKAYKIPLISTDWQISNGVILSLTASIL